jgi:RNA polymerase sigma-70 factor (ECF subfamily)
MAIQNNDVFNEKAFNVLFDTHYVSLCRFAAGYINDFSAAEEIVQQVFINIWDKRNNIEQEKSLSSYLFTSVKNRCLNHIRDSKKFRSYYLDVEAEMEVPVYDHDRISESDLENEIARAIDKLPVKCREVFELCRFEELSYKNTALKLGISVKTVEAQMSKALKILKSELKHLLILFIIWYLTGYF